MTEYQIIEKELIRLGYSKEKGRGDHYRFRKEGVPHTFTVALSIDKNGRAYENMLAEIRRWEPSSTLKRPTKSKADQEMENNLSRHKYTAEQKAIIWKYGFIGTGVKVRYVSPEKRDYSKLEDPNSVMNLEYEVTSFLSDRPFIVSEDDRITIENVDDGHVINDVRPSELDAWEIAACAGCGSQMPVNRLNGNLCPDCTEILKKMRKALRHIKEYIREDGTLTQSCTLPSPTEFPQELLGKSIDEIPADLQLKIYRQIEKLQEEAIKRHEIDSRMKEESKITYDLSAVKDTERRTTDKKPSFTVIWKDLMDRFKQIVLKEDNGMSEDEAKRIMSAIDYRTSVWKKHALLKVYCEDESIIGALYLALGKILNHDKKEPIFKYPAIVELICQKKGVDQYVYNMAETTEKISESLKELEELSGPDSDKTSLIRERLKVPGEAIKNSWETIKAEVCTELQKEGIAISQEGLQFYFSQGLNDDMSGFKVLIEFSASDSSQLELLKANQDSFCRQIMMRMTYMTGYCGSLDVYMSLETTEESLFSPENKVGTYCPTTHPDEDIQESFNEIVEMMLESMGRKDILEWSKKLDTMPGNIAMAAICQLYEDRNSFKMKAGTIVPVSNNNKNQDMKEEQKTEFVSALDFKEVKEDNPLSAYSTKELIRELKKRGCEWEKLTLVVRQEISDEDLE